MPLIGHGECEWKGDMCVLIEPTKPNRILWASRGWKEFCGFPLHDSLAGHTLGIIQGFGTDPADVARIVEQSLLGEEFDAHITNHTASGIPFDQVIHVKPLFASSSEEALTGLLVTTTHACVASGFATPAKVRKGEVTKPKPPTGLSENSRTPLP